MEEGRGQVGVGLVHDVLNRGRYPGKKGSSHYTHRFRVLMGEQGQQGRKGTKAGRK